MPVRPRRHRDWRQALIGWTFALPFVILFGAFMAGPILISFVTSFTDMRITDIRKPFGVGFVGLDNYLDVFRDPTFRKAARNTAVYVIVAVPLTIGLGLLVALGLNAARCDSAGSSASATSCRTSRASSRSPSCGA